MSKKPSEELKSHIDRFCGEEPDSFYKESTTSVGVAKFSNSPADGLTTFISIGLSGHLLHQDSNTCIRQELLITVDNLFSNLAIEQVIFSVVKLIVGRHKAVKRGQVIGPKGLLFPEEKESNLTSVLCSYPAFFPEEFSYFENTETTVFVELIPILTSEAQVIEKDGWSVFFDSIDQGQVNILNYLRS